MLRTLLWALLVTAAAAASHTPEATVKVSHMVLESAAKEFLLKQDLRYSRECKQAVTASWNYHTNVTQENKQDLEEAQERFSEWTKQSWEEARKWTSLLPYFRNTDIARQFKLLSILGAPALPKAELLKYTRIISEMTSIYDSTTVCQFRKPDRCDIGINRGLNKLLRKSRNYSELKHMWKSWRESTGRIRRRYQQFVQLANKAAFANGFRNMAEMSLAQYESETFREDMAAVWEQIKPLYEQLHAFARRKLREVYGSDRVTHRGPLPAHLLGNMWALNWKLDDLFLPFPDTPPVDVTPEMQRQGYDPRRMFEAADHFFHSLNLTRVPASFWRLSVTRVPEDRQVVCHPSSWDFCDGSDFRIKHCTDVTQEDLVTIHHEMTHVQYFLQYRNQPYIYRAGANPGIHEALGHAVALSVETPKHLWRLGLLKSPHLPYEAEMNDLMRRALDKVVFLPYAYLVDLWRWKVLEGSLPEKDWNCGWWDLRYEIQGMKPPELRSEADFDAASKYHIPANIAFTRNFVSFVMQFQLHKSLCMKAGEYVPGDPTKPLHKCDINSSTRAGNAMREIMRLGSSKPWPEVIEAATGERKMDGSALREYFKPLEMWLIEDNKKHGEFVGWRPDGEYCLYEKPRTTDNPARCQTNK
ncbi:angiotensin-converting enzyme-like [Penaeus chinensis]|uniref:angiotensin-converting enzyme-like n=1 Tax=Penaeus chinensis TaxID=139456 RepID=UPI001FB60C63|nr:angiotensin-converting enzyme-like [Penaeus chinensis]